MRGDDYTEEVCTISVTQPWLKPKDFRVEKTSGHLCVNVSDRTGASVTLTDTDYLVLRTVFEGNGFLRAG